MSNPLVRMFSVVLLACSAICSVAQQLKSVTSSVDCLATVPGVRKAYFPKIGTGTDYGPHFPCYSKSTGDIADCVDRFGNIITANIEDAKDDEFQTSVPLDMQQLQLAGFNTVRAYGDTSKIWIPMINNANALNMGIVYQVSTCKSDAAISGSPCINVPGTTFQQVVNFSLVQLRQVIQMVTPAVFQKTVKLIIVGNEDLVISPTDKKTYNTGDLMSAIAQTKTELTNDGVAVNDGTNGGVDLSSATVIGQMTTAPGEQLATAYTPGAPVIENVYGAQFSSVQNPAQAITFLATEVNKMQAQYPNNPAMLGETGWWTAGQDGGYQANKRVGTLADAMAYYQQLYPYITTCSVPTLIFEAFDQPQKGPTDSSRPNPVGVAEAEQHYGVIGAYNTAKDRSMLPEPKSGYVDHPEVAKAAIFKFILVRDVNTAPAMTFGIIQPGQTSQTKVTVQPFAMVTDANGGTTPIWPTFNFYAPDRAKTGSEVFLYRSSQDAKAQCNNTVMSIYAAPQLGPGNQYTAGFSGGIWKFKDYTAPGCTSAPTDVNWLHGTNSNDFGANVFMNANFSTN